jgi:predicted PurR-regulated permease PerM
MSKIENNTRSNQHIVDAAIRIAFLGLIIVWCFMIFKPFVTLIFWSIIIAVTAYPLFQKMTGWFGGRKRIASAVFVLVSIAAVVVPGIGLTGSIVDTGKSLSKDLEAGTLKVPPPNPGVREWPLIGEPFYALWSDASKSLERTLEKHHEQVKTAASWLFSSLAGLGIDILLTIFAIVIAGVLMVNGESANNASIAFFGRMVGHNGKEFSDSSRDTVRSVVKGVVLVAVIQAVLAWIGFAVVDLPAAGIWALAVMILAIVQLPPTIIILPIIIYVFSYASSGMAIGFAIYGILVSISDSFMKPIFLGRGLKTPMLVILIGSLGGMILHGIIGLFIGAVVLAIGYTLYLSWLNGWEMGEDEVLSSNA